jgi:hypothetical protein
MNSRDQVSLQPPANRLNNYPLPTDSGDHATTPKAITDGAAPASGQGSKWPFPIVLGVAY